MQQVDVLLRLAHFGCFFDRCGKGCVVAAEFLIGRINSEMVDGVHGGVQLQELLLHILPLPAKLIVGKTRGQRMCANINGLKIGGHAAVFPGHGVKVGARLIGTAACHTGSNDRANTCNSDSSTSSKARCEARADGVAGCLIVRVSGRNNRLHHAVCVIALA